MSEFLCLQKNFCLCERDLTNVTSTGDAICHITCDGDATSMCGGYVGVSIYSPGNKFENIVIVFIIKLFVVV